MSSAQASPPCRRAASHVAREMLTAFLFCFLISRIVVFLIMAHAMPDLFLHMGGTHVHHLNYGIFLLTGAGAYLLFFQPAGAALTAVTFAYGIALALTFDEFGMWLHLGGGYWQAASVDAVIVIAAILGLIACAPEIKRFRPHHLVTAILLFVVLIAFALALKHYFDYVAHHLGPGLQQLERNGPA